MREGLILKMLRYASHVFTFLHHKVSATRSFSTRRINNNNITIDAYLKSHNLNQRQQDILKAILNKQSIFITGSAGTGKSYVVSRAIELLRTQIYKPDEVFITASTGIAACALNGQTLHSFAGVGLGEGDKEVLFRKVAKNKSACKRWERVKALVIDEISMIRCDLFENLEYIARKIRFRVNKPWGGIQLIVSGDFFQLPPIIDGSMDKEFAFEAECWNASFDLQVELTEIFRQSDTELIDLLQGIRRGRRDECHLQILKQCCNEPKQPSSTVPRLYPRNLDVQRLNNARLAGLGGKIFRYKAHDSGIQPWKRRLTQGIAPDELEICKDARVMLIKNKDLENGLINGAMGTIVDFVVPLGKKHWEVCAKGLIPKVRFDSGLVTVIGPERWETMEGEKIRAARMQIPLLLAWAVSIHKCQGMSLDCLHTDLARAFGYGMVYVALSRARSLKGIYLSGFDSLKIKAHPKVLEFYENQLAS